MARKAKSPRPAWNKARSSFSQQFEDLSAALQAYRERAGKPVHPHLFGNEIRLIKRLVNDGSDQISPDDMSLEQLQSACMLLVKDAELIHADRDYHDRKVTLQFLLLEAEISKDTISLPNLATPAVAANDLVRGSLL